MGCLSLISQNGFTSKGIVKSLSVSFSSAPEKILVKDRESGVNSSLERTAGRTRLEVHRNGISYADSLCRLGDKVLVIPGSAPASQSKANSTVGLQSPELRDKLTDTCSQ